MKFTQEQFKKIVGRKYEYIFINDLPFKNLGIEFLNALPENLQGEILQWGVDDSVTQENLFVYLLKNQFGMTPEEYYQSGLIGKELELDYSKLPDYKKENSFEDILDKYKSLPVYINGVKQEEIEEIEEEEYGDKRILFDKEYYGFEDFFDFDRDMSEIFDFTDFKIPPEFSGRIKVLIEYHPTKEDIEQIKNL